MRGDDLERYSRQIMLEELGEAGQERLGRAAVLVVGCGALGSAQLGLLCRAGVGRLRFIDPDRVELGNLHRQLLYDERDVAAGRPKAEAAAAHLAAVNSGVVLEPLVERAGPGNIAGLLAGMDLVLDASDDLRLRYLLNDACVRAGLPWLYGGVDGAGGMLLAVEPGRGPCLRCLWPDPPAPAGPPPVFPPAPVLVGAQQAALALRRLATGEPLPGRLLLLDAWQASWRALQVERDPHCRCCGARRFDFLPGGKVPDAGDG